MDITFLSMVVPVLGLTVAVVLLAFAGAVSDRV